MASRVLLVRNGSDSFYGPKRVRNPQFPTEALSLSLQSGIDRFAKLKAFLALTAKNEEVHLAAGDPPDKSWKFSGFIWEGMKIYTRKTKRAA